ncbi:MAG: M48 family metallopeptidase [Helicobacteraceae bacterium]|nr:M48 family metallopeptidase [Helicobacteraceae bacterium]
MSEYSNPDVPHEVNVSEKTPLRDFLRLSLGAFLAIGVLASFVFFAARYFAPMIPFRYEEALNANALKPLFRGELAPPCLIKAEEALQNLADELARAMALSDDMRLYVHLSADAEPNAFATLGGNIVVNRGLFKHIGSENALAMVLAHEIAHIKNRDPIAAMGGGIALSVLFSALIGNSDGGSLLSFSVATARTSFSRDQESAADKEAIAALRKYYGYTNGADEFFLYILQNSSALPNAPVFLSSHPATPSRIKEIQASFSPDPQTLKPLSETLQNLENCGFD